MNSISASIVLLAGAILLAVGSLVSHNQTQLFLQLVGSGIGIVGLTAWAISITQASR